MPTIDRAKLRKHANISLQCMPEDMQVRGNAMASGDSAFDKKVEDEIIAQLDRGNEWAWCTVKVTAEFAGVFGYDYLGGCSYKSEADFMTDVYYSDMVDVAVDDLAKKLEKQNDALVMYGLI